MHFKIFQIHYLILLLMAASFSLGCSPLVSKSEYVKLQKQYQELDLKYQDLLKKVPHQELFPQDSSISVESNNTVDIFSDLEEVKQNEIPQSKIQTPSVDFTKNDIRVDEAKLKREIGSFKLALQQYEAKNYDISMKEFKSLESSGHLQIRVASKFYIAEILYHQHEFDLASQAYEEIIHKYAFSGKVIDSLKRVIECSNKLNLTEKAERYLALLKNMFPSSI